MAHEFNIRNIVIKATCATPLVISDVVYKLGHGNYDPSRFSAIILKFRNPKMTLNIFSSGIMILMGSKTVHSAYYVLQKIITKIGVELVDVYIANILATLNLNKEIDINDVFSRNRDRCICDKTLFPSLVFRRKDSSNGSSIFSSGKITVYGCKSIQEINETVDIILNEIL